MKRAPTDKPNLDDVLARDFAQLKVGETNLKEDERAAEPVKKEQATAIPRVYNQRIDAVEDRETFVVKAPATQPKEADQENGEKRPPTVLKTPSTQPGDDFDVDW